MKNERWKRVESLYLADADMEKTERRRFLENACQGDRELLQEIESLLLHDELEGSSLDRQAPYAELRRNTSMIGNKLAHYQITMHLGSGGMGDVYQATDSKLGRSVAIKLLPEAFARDTDRVARFDREARVLATLNHPNIAAIYGVEESGERKFLVMELVAGETLAERIQRGPIPVDEALGIAKQICEALETAHDNGVIHRDLKPANIKITPDGKVKILDFGLAKACEPNPSNASLSNSPTMANVATNTGVILGTAAYMSPEQAKGRMVDRRTDIFAFGCVLYEMLAGTPAFDGEDATEIVSAVLKSEPDWALLPSNLPREIRRLLRLCLEKNVKNRRSSATDVRLDIEETIGKGLDETTATPLVKQPTRWRALPWALAVVVLVVAATLAWRAVDRGQPSPVYATIDAPADYVLGEDDRGVSLPTRTPMVFTPDGRSLIIQAARGGKPQLFIRSLDRPDAQPIAGTDDARVPFVSPDGKWIGFSAANELRKVPIEGGTPTTICLLGALLGPMGASWGTGDAIVFGDTRSNRIMRVSAGGGTPAPVTELPQRGHLHVAPFFLPDGKRFLFSDVAILDANDARVMIQSLDGGDARLVLASATDGRLLTRGRLAFMRLGTLMTVGFDVGRAEVTGDAVASLGGVMQSGLRARANANNTGAGMFAVSSLGTLALIRGAVTGGEESHLIWVTADGRSSSAEPASGAPVGARLYNRISPDRSRAVVTLIKPTRFEIWFAEWTRDVWTPCADCSGDLLRPVQWSPDGRRLLFSRYDALVAHTLDGSAPDQVLVREADRTLETAAWLIDGSIVYESLSQGSGEIKLLEAGGSAGRVIVPFGVGRNSDASHDGHWLAYAHPQAGQTNVVVQALQGPESRIQVSAGGGDDPVWSADGRTLYYVKPLSDPPGSAMFAVDINTIGGLTAGKPHELFRDPKPGLCNGRCYDLFRDGPRFLLADASVRGHPSVTRMDLVLNWTATLPKAK